MSYDTLKLVRSKPDIEAKAKQYFGSESDAVLELLMKESSLNPYAVNKSSGATGLFQRLPASTLTNECPDLSDIDCQMRNGKKYIENRYGTPTNALNFWLRNKWY